jgi:hypothetical protein
MAESCVSDELIDNVRLALVPGVGPRLRKVLLARFGSAAGVWAASNSELQSVEGDRAEDRRQHRTDFRLLSMAAQELDRPGCLWLQGYRPLVGQPGPFPAQSSLTLAVSQEMNLPAQSNQRLNQGTVRRQEPSGRV